jgi:hypothetical protein
VPDLGIVTEYRRRGNHDRRASPECVNAVKNLLGHKVRRRAFDRRGRRGSFLQALPERLDEPGVTARCDVRRPASIVPGAGEEEPHQMGGPRFAQRLQFKLEGSGVVYQLPHQIRIRRPHTGSM